MLFQVSNRPRGGTAEQEQILAIFDRWEAPAGFEFKGFWIRADGGVLAVVEVESAEALLKAVAPWAGSLQDYEFMPLVEVDRGVELMKEGIAFRNA